MHTSYGHTYALINQPAVAPGRGAAQRQIFRELAAAMGFDEPCFRTTTRPGAQASRRRSTSRRCAPDGWACMPAEAPFADGGFAAFGQPSSTPGLAADFVPNHESAPQHPELAARYPLAMISPPARNFLNPASST